MNPRQLLLIFRARYKVALLLLILTVAISVVVTLKTPAQYTATASVLVDVRANDPLSAMIMPSSLATQMDIITSDRVASKVMKQLKMTEDAELKEQWMLATGGDMPFEEWIV